MREPMITEEDLERPKLLLTDSINGEHYEDKCQKQIVRNRIVEELHRRNFDINPFFVTDRVALSSLYKFNTQIRDICKKANVTLVDLIVYFEENYTSIQRIRSLLDEENLQIIKNELAENYSIIIPNTLKKFLKEKKKDGLPVE